jgi:hypothetical protein
MTGHRACVDERQRFAFARLGSPKRSSLEPAELNQRVIALINTYPDQGFGGYVWPSPPGQAGTTRVFLGWQRDTANAIDSSGSPRSLVPSTASTFALRPATIPLHGDGVSRAVAR